LREEAINIAFFKLGSGINRPHYFKEKFLTESDFRDEQSYNLPEAENKLRQATIRIESGDLRGAGSIAMEAEQQYRKAALDAIKHRVIVAANKNLQQTRTTISPEVLQRAEAELEEIMAFVEGHEGREFVIGELFAGIHSRIQQILSSAGVEIAIAELPDLVVENVTIHPERIIAGEEIIVHAVIRNIGGAPAEEIGVLFLDLEGRKGAESIIRFLEPGQAEETRIVTAEHEAGYWRITVQVDPKNLIEESNEQNNAKSKIAIVDKKKLKPIPLPGIMVATTHDSVYGYIQDKSKLCSLREAILLANQSFGPDTILFSVPLTDAGYDAGRGVWVFQFKKQLPGLKDEGTVIDGLWKLTSGSIFGACPKPKIELDGKKASGQKIDTGLHIQGDYNTIKGLAIFNFAEAGILMEGDNNELTCNFIGTNVNEDKGIGNEYGIVIKAGSGVHTAFGPINNKIGMKDKGNLISGNQEAGVLLTGKEVSGNIVQANYIGLKTDGAIPLPNRNGISLENETKANQIGGYRSSGEQCSWGCNVISGNKANGVTIEASEENSVKGNFIGVGATGTIKCGNGREGVLILGADNNEIEKNVISGNRNGVVIKNNLSHQSGSNKIQGNYIGTNYTATLPLPNSQNGILITEKSKGNVIGLLNLGNVISGNIAAGIRIDNGASENSIIYNWIGTNKNGALLGNGYGVALYSGAYDNSIGNKGVGDFYGANTIAFNKGNGVHIEGKSTINNAAHSNYIHDNGGKGIALVNEGNSPQPKIKIFDVAPVNLKQNTWIIIGQVTPPANFYQVVLYSDNDDQGKWVLGHELTRQITNCSFEFNGVKLPGKNFMITVSRTPKEMMVAYEPGTNTSEYYVLPKAAHVGSWPFDMDYYRVDQDNNMPLNPHYHGGWYQRPPYCQTCNFNKNNWGQGTLFTTNNVAHDVFTTSGTWCGPFLNYRKIAMFTGKIYWESHASDDDYNMGLWTPAMAGVHLNTQRYYDPKTPNPYLNQMGTIGACPPKGCDANNWPSNYAIENFVNKGHYPILTLEFDSDETIDHWDKPDELNYFWWDDFHYNAVDKADWKAQKMIDGKKAIAIGVWCMDGAHWYRTEIHPVYGLAIQTEDISSGKQGQEEWQFFIRNRGNQNWCGEQVKVKDPIPDWYFRFPGQPKAVDAKVVYLKNDESVKCKLLKKGNDVLLRMHLPGKKYWAAGTITIIWK